MGKQTTNWRITELGARADNNTTQSEKNYLIIIEFTRNNLKTNRQRRIFHFHKLPFGASQQVEAKNVSSLPIRIIRQMGWHLDWNYQSDVSDLTVRPSFKWSFSILYTLTKEEWKSKKCNTHATITATIQDTITFKLVIIVRGWWSEREEEKERKRDSN